MAVARYKANLREHVVNNVVLNNAVEDVTANEAKIAVHSGGCTLDESPVVSLVVRSLGVSVVKVSNSDCGELVFSTLQLEERHAYQSSGSSRGKADHMREEQLRFQRYGTRHTEQSW